MKTFGPYEVIDLVAAGSTGTVYRARHTELDRVAAIKELNPAMRNLPGLVERLREEARLLGELDNEHVVAVYDFVEEADSAWLAEEWVKGASLEAILLAHQQLTPEQSLGVLRGALTGLASAHDRGLVHRDIAPTNILADMRGVSKLVDFGLAAPVGRTGVCGTPAYVSPEAASGAATDKSSDVYSAAAVLFTLLTGHPPFRATDPSTMLRSHMHEPAPALPGQGGRLRDLLSRAMAKDPTARPPDAAAFLQELEQAAEERCGAGWLTRASIAGLVASTAAGATAAASGGSALVAAGDAPVVTVASGSTGAVAKAGRKGVSKVALTAAAVLTVAVAGTAAAVAVTRGSDSGAPALPAAVVKAKASAAAAAKVSDERRASAPAGVYTLKDVTVASTVEGWAVGATTTEDWTLSFTCNPRSCTGSSEGKDATLFAEYDGKALVLDQGGPVLDEGPCADSETGELDPATHFKRETVYDVEPLLVTKRAAPTADGPGVPTEFKGTIDVTVTVLEVSGNCDKDPVQTATIERTLTKRGG